MGRAAAAGRRGACHVRGNAHHLDGEDARREPSVFEAHGARSPVVARELVVRLPLLVDAVVQVVEAQAAPGAVSRLEHLAPAQLAAVAEEAALANHHEVRVAGSAMDTASSRAEGPKATASPAASRSTTYGRPSTANATTSPARRPCAGGRRLRTPRHSRRADPGQIEPRPRLRRARTPPPWPNRRSST